MIVGSFASTTAANTVMYTIETGHAVAAVTRGTVSKNYTGTPPMPGHIYNLLT